MFTETAQIQPLTKEPIPEGQNGREHSSQEVLTGQPPYREIQLTLIEKLDHLVNTDKLHVQSELATLEKLGFVDRNKFEAFYENLRELKKSMSASDNEKITQSPLLQEFLRENRSEPEAYFAYLLSSLAANEDVLMSHVQVSTYSGNELKKAEKEMPLLTSTDEYWNNPILRLKYPSYIGQRENGNGIREVANLVVLYATSGLDHPHKYPIASFSYDEDGGEEKIYDIRCAKGLNGDAIDLVVEIGKSAVSELLEMKTQYPELTAIEQSRNVYVTGKEDNRTKKTEGVVGRSNLFWHRLIKAAGQIIQKINPMSISPIIESETLSQPGIGNGEIREIIEERLPRIATYRGSSLSDKQRTSLVRAYAKVFSQWNDPAYTGVSIENVAQGEIPQRLLDSKEQYLRHEGAFSDDCLVSLIEDNEEVYAFAITTSRETSRVSTLQLIEDSIRHIYPELFPKGGDNPLSKLISELTKDDSLPEEAILFQDLGSRVFDIMKLINKRLGDLELNKDEKKYLYRAYSLSLVEKHVEALAKLNSTEALDYFFWTIEASAMHAIARQRPDCYRTMGKILPEVEDSDSPKIFIYSFTHDSLLKSIGSPDSFERKKDNEDVLTRIVTYSVSQKLQSKQPEPKLSSTQ